MLVPFALCCLHHRTTLQSSPQCCPSAAFGAAVVACNAATSSHAEVVVLTRHRAQCILNFHAIQFVLRHFDVRGRLEVATSLGYQRLRTDEIFFCFWILPLLCMQYRRMTTYCLVDSLGMILFCCVLVPISFGFRSFPSFARSRVL